MSFMSATEIGKKLGLSYQKVNKVLAENGLYDGTSRRPTAHALENGLAEIKSTESRFTGKTVEFNAWDFGKLATLFPKPKKQVKKQVKTIHLRTSEDAYDQICITLSDFGNMLKIDPDINTNGISGEAHDAVVQAYFGDLHYCNGLLLLHHHFKPHEALNAQLVTLRVAAELHKAAKCINPKRANSNLHAIEITTQWLCDMAQKP
ncbi:MAG: hypothetical protein HOP24_10150 [Sideroxydans sp.]|nr:hypothetical protein [Sideroxydans sp.]